MLDKTENTRRLAKNTILLYLRSLFSLFVSLYSSRLILQALGVEDYGIYNAVGGFASMFWLVSGSISSAISRFITIEQGRKDQEKLNLVFSMSLNIMAILGVIVVLAALAFGPWFIHNKMTVPPDRMSAAINVFYLSIVTVVSGFLIVPFNGAIIAHEKMGAYALVSVMEAVLRLLLGLFLVYGTYSADTLNLYAVLCTISTLLIQSFATTFCVKHFQECRFRPLFDKKVFGEMASFASWTFIGSISQTFSGQGVNVVVNMFFGPLLNAARGIAATIENVVSLLVKNFTIALSPQITKSYAAGELDYMKSLVYMGTKFSTYIMYFFVLPLTLEAEFVLNIWLVEVPEYAVIFVRLTMINCMTGMLDGIFGYAQNATGKVRNYQLIRSIIVFLNFPLTYLLLKLGAGATSAYIVSIGLAIPRIISILMITHRSLQFSYWEVFKRIYVGVILSISVSMILPTLIHFTMPSGWPRFLAVGFVSVICSLSACFFIGCTKQERQYVLQLVRSFLKKPPVAAH